MFLPFGLRHPPLHPLFKEKKLSLVNSGWSVLWALTAALFPVLFEPIGSLAADSPQVISSPVKLIFIHHSRGENRLSDETEGWASLFGTKTILSATPIMVGDPGAWMSAATG